MSKPHTSELNCNFSYNINYLVYVVLYILDAVI